MSTGKWREPGVPHKGWSCVEVEDLETPSMTCEMCETTEIRYAHHMTHPEYAGTLRCGCICAGHLEEDLAGARSRESKARQKFKRKAAWAYRWWKESMLQNHWTRLGKHIVTVMRPAANEGWKIRVFNTKTRVERMGQVPWPSEEAAKAAAFDALEWLKARGE